MAYRQWLPNPTETVGVRLEDDAMHPILPAGSIVAVDHVDVRPASTPGADRRGRPSPTASPLVRWLDISGRHLILRPNQPSKDHPLIPVELEGIRDGAHHRAGRLVVEPVQPGLTAPTATRGPGPAVGPASAADRSADPARTRQARGTGPPTPSESFGVGSAVRG